MSGRGLWLERCPSCRLKQEAEAPEEAPCARCGGELTSLRRVYRAASGWQEASRRAIAAGDGVAALLAARRALVLLDVPEVRRTYGAALVLAGGLVAQR